MLPLIVASCYDDPEPRGGRSARYSFKFSFILECPQVPVTASGVGKERLDRLATPFESSAMERYHKSILGWLESRRRELQGTV